MDIVKACRERAEGYGALRQSALTARVLTEAAATIEALRAELAARDAEIAAWLRRQKLTMYGVEIPVADAWATAIASGAYREGEAK